MVLCTGRLMSVCGVGVVCDVALLMLSGDLDAMFPYRIYKK